LLRVLVPITCLVVCIFIGQHCRAERGYVLVEVQDTQKRPVRGVEIGIDGLGGSKLSGEDGKAKIPIGNAANEGDWFSLTLLHSPGGKDLAIISPWDNRAQIPSFADKPENFVLIVVVQRGDRAALESGSVLASIVAKIDKANFSNPANDQNQREDPTANLDLVAKQYGLSPGEVDQAIRAWGAKTTDPYDAGLAALYIRDFPKASAQLQDSLKRREENLTADQESVAQDQDRVAAASFFLGLSLFHEGKYQESEHAFDRALQIRPDEAASLNNKGLDLWLLGDHEGAELLFRKAMQVSEKALGPDNLPEADYLHNLAEMHYGRGDYAGAEPLYRRALAITEKTMGPDSTVVAPQLDYLGRLLKAKGDTAEAESSFRQALAIFEKAEGPDDPDLIIYIVDLASLLNARGDNAEAEPLFRRALAISSEKASGANYLVEADRLEGLGAYLSSKGDYSGAETFLRRVVAMREKALGPDNSEAESGPNSPRDTLYKSQARSLSNLANVLNSEGDHAGAEALFRRALDIDERTLGPSDPTVGNDLNNIANPLKERGDYAGAETLCRRALAILDGAQSAIPGMLVACLNNLADILNNEADYPGAEAQYRRVLQITEKTLGPDDPNLAGIIDNLAHALFEERKYAEAEPLLRRALEIQERALKPDDPSLAATLEGLGAVLYDNGDCPEAE
jgi:tetratricopeptide (TPR) repeat protein